MIDTKFYGLVHKELTGQLSEEEFAELAQLRANNPSEGISQDISAIWAASKEYMPSNDWKKADAKAALMQRIKADAQAIPNTTPTSTVTKSNTGKYITIGLALLTLVLGGMYFLNQTEDQDEIDNRTEVIEYAMLNDETKLWIGEGSVVKVSEFSDTERKVELVGEAIFDVARDEARPFVIDLGNDVFAEVLGTSFKATSTHDGEEGSIAVREGKVRLFSTEDSSIDMILNAGDYGSFNPKSLAKMNSKVTRPIVLDQDEEISFQNTPMTEVFESLESFYGVEIQVEGSIKCNHTSPLVKNSSLDDALAIILITHSNLSVVETGRSTYRVTGSCE